MIRNSGIKCRRDSDDGRSVTASSDVSSPMRPIRMSKDCEWPGDVVLLFLEILIKHKRSGELTSSTFKVNVWNTIVEELFISTSRQYTVKQDRDKFNHLRTDYKVFDHLIHGDSTSGFGWDPLTLTFTAIPQVWNEYVKSHKDVKKFQKQGCPHFLLFEKIFVESTTTGHLSRSIMQLALDSDEERMMENASKATGKQAAVGPSRRSVKRMSEDSGDSGRKKACVAGKRTICLC